MLLLGEVLPSGRETDIELVIVKFKDTVLEPPPDVEFPAPMMNPVAPLVATVLAQLVVTFCERLNTSLGGQKGAISNC